MRKGCLLFIVAAFLAGATNEAVDAGAKDGRIRWQNNKDTTGKWKVNPPIKVEAKSIVELKIEFKANELAEFFVIGDGDTDVDLIVKNSNGDIVVQDVDPAERGSDLCVCRWTPGRNEVFSIFIINNDPKLYNNVTAGCN